MVCPLFDGCGGQEAELFSAGCGQDRLTFTVHFALCLCKRAHCETRHLLPKAAPCVQAGPAWARTRGAALNGTSGPVSLGNGNKTHEKIHVSTCVYM